MNRLIIFLLFFSSCNDLLIENKVLRTFDEKYCKDIESKHECLISIISNDKNSKDHSDVCFNNLNVFGYIDNLDEEIFNYFWIKRNGYQRNWTIKADEPTKYIGYSDNYLKILKSYINSEEGKWFVVYFNKYNQMNDISPSLIQNFDSIIIKQNLDDRMVRLIFWTHHITLAYNYCK